MPQDVHYSKVVTTRVHTGVVQVQVEVSGSTLESNKCGDIFSNGVTIYMVHHVGKIRAWPLISMYILSYLRIISGSTIFIFNGMKILGWDCQGFYELTSIDSISVKDTITDSNRVSWVWVPDINDILFYMRSLVKSDAKFWLENMEVKKFEKWALLRYKWETFVSVNKEIMECTGVVIEA